MSSDNTSSTGETTQNFLEKITPKDLVMFSPAVRKQIAKNDFSYLGVDYDLQISKEEDDQNIRVWGLPKVSITDPAPLGLISGLAIGSLANLYKIRPLFSSIHVHALSALAVGVSAKIAYDKYAEYRTEKELVIWDYVKKHPKDFPEVFNPPKKYKDLLLEWKPNR